MSEITDPAADPAERVEQWFIQHCEVELEGIEVGREGGSVAIKFHDPLDTEVFRAALEKKGYDVEDLGTDSETALTVYEVTESSGGVVQEKTGSIYREKSQITFDDVEVPIWKNGEVAGDVVEDTLKHIACYLEERYSISTGGGSIFR